MSVDILMSNLKSKGFDAVYFETPEEAVQYMVENVQGKTVGIGGSLTVKELGLDVRLEEKNTLYWHWITEQIQKYGDAKAVRDLAADTDVYISSANAIAETGQIVNIDGTGNRIASLAYGHKEVYIIAGINKITENLESALWRARNVASPKNAQRLGRKTPCAVKGDKCYDCSSPERICRGFLTLERPMGGVKTVVVLIGTVLGA